MTKSGSRFSSYWSTQADLYTPLEVCWASQPVSSISYTWSNLQSWSRRKSDFQEARYKGNKAAALEALKPK